MNASEWLHLRHRITNKQEENEMVTVSRIACAWFFFIGVTVGLVLGFFIMPSANADPSCGGNGPSADGSCQWWRNLPGAGQPGTYSPGLGGPGFYTPCTGNAASKASSSCIGGE